MRLPSEAEWEKAARGGLEIPEVPIVRPPAALDAGTAAVDNADPRREYPWGGPFEAEHANVEETGIGTSSPVGAFSRGASPYGCEEMSGNVWEWTRSLWGTEWLKPAFGYLYDPGDGRESPDAGREVLRVLRGGSFIGLQRNARCSCRSGYSPDDRSWGVGFRVVVSPFSSGL